MVIDTSAIVAILLDEPEHYRFDRLIEADDFLHTDIVPAYRAVQGR
jgi:uncharacterized protein with PIN domain